MKTTLFAILMTLSLISCKKEYNKNDEPEGPAKKTIIERLANGEKPQALLDEYTAAEIIGNVYQGDTIFFVSNDKSMIYREYNLQCIWGDWLLNVPNTDSINGQNNTDTIVLYNRNNCYRIAARECKDNGYFLPSIEELKMIDNLIDYHPKKLYWSSTQINKEAAYGYNFDRHNTYGMHKMQYCNVFMYKVIL